MPHFSAIMEFFSAVFGHLQNWLSGGGAGGLMVIATSLIERLTGKSLSKKTHVAIFVIGFFLFACMMAWSDEYEKVLATKGDLAKLEGRLESPEFNMTQDVWWGPGGRDMQITITGNIENPAGPPSAAIKWQLRLEFAARVVIGEIHIPPNKDMTVGLNGRKEKLVLPRNAYLPENTLAPIPTGGAVSGWIVATFRNVSEEDMHNSPTLIISCIDVVSHKVHEFKTVLNGTKGLTIPGTPHR
jgi:hypothetical protein